MSHLLRIMLTIIGCFALASCSVSKKKVETSDIFSSEIASNVPPSYKPFYTGRVTEEEVKSVRDRLPFDSISISRTGCLGSCPAYEMVLYRDGSAKLNAQAYLPKIGKFVGEVRLNTYGRLCYLIESSHFSKMNSNYNAEWTCDSTCIVTVKSGKTVKTVSDYGQVGPIQLWAIQELLDSVKDNIEWTPTK